MDNSHPLVNNRRAKKYTTFSPASAHTVNKDLPNQTNRLLLVLSDGTNDQWIRADLSLCSTPLPKRTSVPSGRYRRPDRSTGRSYRHCPVKSDWYPPGRSVHPWPSPRHSRQPYVWHRGCGRKRFSNLLYLRNPVRSHRKSVLRLPTSPAHRAVRSQPCPSPEAVYSHGWWKGVPFLTPRHPKAGDRSSCLPAHTKRQTEIARHITGPTIVLQIYSAYLFDSSVPLPEEPDTE